MEDFFHGSLRRAEDLAEADGGEPADREDILAPGKPIRGRQGRE